LDPTGKLFLAQGKKNVGVPWYRLPNLFQLVTPWFSDAVLGNLKGLLYTLYSGVSLAKAVQRGKSH
jgi:hypothetical protein